MLQLSRLAAVTFVTAALAFTVVSCTRTQTYTVEGSSTVYTLTNLHPDTARRMMYSLNYQADGFIPVCTQVNVDSVTSREMRLTLVQTGEQYRYLFTGHMRDPLEMHMSKYFGPNCPDLSVLSDADRAGIQQGEVFQGMSKQGVLIAIGYPPEHRTPSLDADEWSYWSSRMRRFAVRFTNGVVTGIRR